MQKAQAKLRGIEWRLTFYEWYKWWLDSGHYHERGRRQGQYVMGRIGDIGPYALNNIMCIQVKENGPYKNNTHCKRGHPLSGDNMFVGVQNGYSVRLCRKCAVIRTTRNRLKHRNFPTTVVGV